MLHSLFGSTMMVVFFIVITAWQFWNQRSVCTMASNCIHTVCSSWCTVIISLLLSYHYLFCNCSCVALSVLE